MSDIIPLECPRCKHAWQKSLRLLERDEEIYRQAKGEAERAPEKIASYRDQCPVCGIYVIVSVQED
jgi:hypothetical protein